MKLEYRLEDFDKKKIIDKYGMQENGDAHLFMANNCFRRMHKYVPFETGALASTVTVKPKSVTYEQPYAHRQYKKNKGKGIRGRLWDRKMKSNEGKMLAKELENYMKKLKGSR